MIGRVRQWRQDSRDLDAIIRKAQISRQAALNALKVVRRERRTRGQNPS